jgi:hypothetical protein
MSVTGNAEIKARIIPRLQKGMYLVVLLMEKLRASREITNKHYSITSHCSDRKKYN